MKQIEDKQIWDKFVTRNSGHPLQLWGWGETKALHGWKVIRYQSDDGTWGSQVLFKRLPRPMHSVAYVPRGPVGVTSPALLSSLATSVKAQEHSDVIMLEPPYTSFTAGKGWRTTKNTILIPHTVMLDITQSDEDLLADMAKKTRQYIRKSLATIHVKRIVDAAELEACMDVYRQTAHRAGFALHDEEYYFDIYRLVEENVHIYGAYEGETLVAFVWLIATPEVAFELYGGMTQRGQELRANYGLKWEAIRACKALSIRTYDMNGLLNDGVSGFKRGFASRETHLVGTLEKPLSLWYPIWAYGLPIAKRIARLFRS